MSNSKTQEADAPEALSPGEYLTRRVEDQIDWYDRKSLWNQRWFKRLRAAEIVAAAMIPFLTAIPEPTTMRYVVGGLGVAITIIAGILALYQFQERWAEYRAACESLRMERYLFLTGTEPYAGADAFPTLVRRAESLISKETTNWAQTLIKRDEGGTHGARRDAGEG
jgi:hypothetical protein